MHSFKRIFGASHLTGNLLQQILNIPRVTLQKSSQYQRPQLSRKPNDRLQEIKSNFFQKSGKITNEEWHEIRVTLINLFNHINKNNVDATILGICNEGDKPELAKNYIAYLETIGVEPNVATLGRLLRSYYMKYQSSDLKALGTQEQTEVLEICANIRNKHDILDGSTCENLIHGLVATDSWRDAVELLKMIKLTAKPSVSAYTVVIVKAFREDNNDIGWGLLHEMLDDRKQPKCEIFITFLKSIDRGDEKIFLRNFEILLEFLHKYELPITDRVSQSICEHAEKYPHTIKATRTRLNSASRCKSCGGVLKNVSISNMEFAQLSDSFLNKVLIRNDVFQKSTPEEVELFKRFVSETGPYDCVIDGLNVAYSMGLKKSPKVFADMLAAVVKYFKDKNQHVLVLGRKHMTSWSKEKMQFIKRNACVFLTNNLSHDDPFMLYATMKSGQSTDFFSRDLMRSHAYLLGPELKGIFRRWQQEHQYSLVTRTHDGKLIIKEPVRHLIFAHKVNTTWHIPSKTDYSANPSENFEVPENWLCIKFQNKE